MKLIPTGIAALLVTASVTYAADADPVKKEMLKELIQLNTHLDLQAKKIDKLSKFVSTLTEARMHDPDGADRELLSKIKFPEKPTKEKLKKYIKEIEDASRHQHSFASDDPQIEMLKKVGHMNLDLLAEECLRLRESPYDTFNDMYIKPAIVQLVGQNDKALVIKLLPEIPDLINVVLKYGWEENAKEFLINRVKYSPCISDDMIRVVAGFRDPSTYNALVSNFVRNPNPHEVFPYIKDLPIDLDEAINGLWLSAKYSGQPWQIGQVASMALEYGNVDAFEYVLDKILLGNVKSYNIAQLCFLINKYSDKEGTTEEISQWVKKNRKQLYFDKKEKKFKVVPAKKSDGRK